MKRMISLLLTVLILISGSPIPSAFADTPFYSDQSAEPQTQTSTLDEKTKAAVDAAITRAKEDAAKLKLSVSPWGSKPESLDHWKTVDAKEEKGKNYLTQYWNNARRKLYPSLIVNWYNLNCRTSECGNLESGKSVPLYYLHYWGFAPSELKKNLWYSPWYWYNSSGKNTRYIHYLAVKLPFELVKEGDKLYIVDSVKNGALFKTEAKLYFFNQVPPRPSESKAGENADLMTVALSDITPPAPRSGTGGGGHGGGSGNPGGKPGEPGGQPNPGTGQPGTETPATTIDEAIKNLGLGTEIEKAMTKYYLTHPDLDKDVIPTLKIALRKHDEKFRKGEKDIQKAFIDAVNGGKKAELMKAIRDNIVGTTTGLLLKDDEILQKKKPEWLNNLNPTLNGVLTGWKSTPPLSQEDLLRFYCSNGGADDLQANTPPSLPNPTAATNPADLTKLGIKEGVLKANKKLAQIKQSKMNTDAANTPEGAAAVAGRPVDNSQIPPPPPPIIAYCKNLTSPDTTSGNPPPGKRPEATIDPPSPTPDGSKPASKKPGEDKDKNEQRNKDIMGGIYGMAGFGLIGLAMFGPPGFVAGLAMGFVIGALVVHLSFK